MTLRYSLLLSVWVDPSAEHMRCYFLRPLITADRLDTWFGPQSSSQHVADSTPGSVTFPSASFDYRYMDSTSLVTCCRISLKTSGRTCPMPQPTNPSSRYSLFGCMDSTSLITGRSNPSSEYASCIDMWIRLVSRPCCRISLKTSCRICLTQPVTNPSSRCAR